MLKSIKPLGCWCIPPKQNAAFVAAMEDVLAVYTRPLQEDIPLVRLDHFANNLLTEAAKIILVMDNLNTHKEASLYEAFPTVKARALCERFEIHYTPKHGSWLNMVEIEFTNEKARGKLKSLYPTI